MTETVIEDMNCKSISRTISGCHSNSIGLKSENDLLAIQLILRKIDIRLS